MKYYLIHNSDGDTMVSEYEKETLLKEIESGEWGDGEWTKAPEFLESIADLSSDTNEWGGKMLLIKGEIVTLKKKEVVTKYDID